ncbi:MAG: ethylbenzene dehydrogenase-related protein [Anaerolineae bacterium]
MKNTQYAIRNTVYLFLGVLLILAFAASMLNAPLMAAPQADIVSTFVSKALPVGDPLSPLWEQATPVDVPLSAQNIAKPLHLSPSVKSARLRSLHNGRNIAFLLEWDDPERNLGLGHDAYKDAAALQLPLDPGQPFVCMGIQGQGVNILHWRADFQNDVEGGFADIETLNPRLLANVYPHADDPAFMPARAASNPLSQREKLSPVEDLSAVGFGTLSAQVHNDAVGWGTWQDGRWQAVFARPLVTIDSNDAQLEPGMTTSVAVAVWDGAKKERDGMKAVSAWLALELEKAPPAEVVKAPPAEVEEAPLAEAAKPAPAEVVAPRPAGIGIFMIVVGAGLAAMGVGYILGRWRPSPGEHS